MKFECAMWPFAVVVADVDAYDALELPTVKDEQPVETFAADAADPAFHVRVCVRRPDRGSDNACSLAAEECVERVGELGVPVVDQEARLLTAADQC